MSFKDRLITATKEPIQFYYWPRPDGWKFWIMFEE